MERVEIRAVIKAHCPTCNALERQPCHYIALETHLGQVLIRPHSARLRRHYEMENGL